MFATLLATMTAVASLQLAMPTDSMLTSRVRVDDHLQVAHRAMSNGEFDIARREFSAAVVTDRDAGRLPVESSIGLANALYAQAYNVEAAITMERLANEAALKGDTDTEAIALADAIWLNADAGQRVAARRLTDRLRAIMKDTPLSMDARKAIKTRLG